MRPLFASPPRKLLKLCLGPLARCGTHQETMVGDSNKCIFHLTQDWTCLGRGHYSSWIVINGGGGGKLLRQTLRNVCTMQVTPGQFFTSGLGPLARYGTGVNDYQMYLNIYIKFVKITYHCPSFWYVVRMIKRIQLFVM